MNAPTSTPQSVPRRPYLLRALYDWMVDSRYTPYIIVDALGEGVDVPRQYVKDGKIVLNLSPAATHGLQLGSEALEFNARFGGVTRHLRIPMQTVLGIYARETGEGMVFSENDWMPKPPSGPEGPKTRPEGPKSPSAAEDRRARFKVVK